MDIDTLNTAQRVVEKIESLNDNDAIAECLATYLCIYGLKHMVVTSLPGPQTAAWHKSIAYDSWPEGWLERYNERGHFVHDPCVMHARSAPSPFLWSSVTSNRLSIPQARVMSEAAEFLLKDGICVPIHLPYQPTWVISAAGPQSHLTQLGLPAIEMVCVQAFRALVDTHNARSEHPTLTYREREVLSWTAAGKSAEDVACILGISRYTVDRHLTNIREKYGAVNTLHAVAKAMANGDIIP